MRRVPVCGDRGRWLWRRVMLWLWLWMGSAVGEGERGEGSLGRRGRALRGAPLRGGSGSHCGWDERSREERVLVGRSHHGQSSVRLTRKIATVPRRDKPIDHCRERRQRSVAAVPALRRLREQRRQPLRGHRPLPVHDRRRGTRERCERRQKLRHQSHLREQRSREEERGCSAGARARRHEKADDASGGARERRLCQERLADGRRERFERSSPSEGCSDARPLWRLWRRGCHSRSRGVAPERRVRHRR
mmetsp:Transcript_15692/g.51488  ORF Transcript_15692/g.51488 Transcript_15692/m.51488 type:complete len:248 (-) Transcript_15692:66-809(-)